LTGRSIGQGLFVGCALPDLAHFVHGVDDLGIGGHGMENREQGIGVRDKWADFIRQWRIGNKKVYADACNCDYTGIESR